jgi:hypothetical protein
MSFGKTRELFQSVVETVRTSGEKRRQSKSQPQAIKEVVMRRLKGKYKQLFERDPWLALKFAAVAISLGIIGKAMLFGAVNGCGVSTTYAQFIPTLPMMTLSFLAQRHLWGCKSVSFWSYMGASWSVVCGAQFVVNHGLFTLCTTVFGWHYLLVSSGLGLASACVTFTLNELKLLAKYSTTQLQTVTA